MTPKLRSFIPNHMLKPGRTRPLMEWLHIRGCTMTLLELEQERRARGIIR